MLAHEFALAELRVLPPVEYIFVFIDPEFSFSLIHGNTLSYEFDNRQFHLL